MMSEKIAVISYRREDSTDMTGRIYDRLITAFGKEAVFKDVDSVPLGLHFAEYISSTIEKCHVVIAVIGNKWWGDDGASGRRRLDDPNDFVRIEIETALKHGIPIIPLLIKDMGMPEETELPDTLKRLVFCNGIPVRIDPDFHRDVDALITGLVQMGFQRLDMDSTGGRVNLPAEISAYLRLGDETTPILQVPFTIGRHRSNSLTLSSSNVSKHHARITFVDDNFYLEDLGSTNGVYLRHGQKEVKLEAGKPFPLDFSTCFQLGQKDSAPLLTFEIGVEERTVME